MASLRLILLTLVLGCTPEYFRQPVPPPVVDPVITGTGWVVIVEEQADRATNGTAPLLNDIEFWASLQPNYQHQIFDKDDSSERAKDFLKVIAGKNVSPPAIVVTDQTGSVKRVAPLPKTKQEVLKLLAL